MRNLKKILALVLALVMSLSLVTTAGAFSDDGDINADYDDAITVLSGLEVFKGYSDGTFQPKGNITRAEVAAIIYRIVTGDVTDKQASIYSTYGQFTDVKDGAWYAGYVNYCANAGYIKGRGNKIFDPQATVTGYEALAMILRAVGYDKNGEFTGSNWQINTASIGRERGVLKNVVEGLLGQAASRELVAEILFRSVIIPKVDFNANTLSYKVKGEKETLGYESFKLEEITGIVTGNEYADLESGKTMREDKTRMIVNGSAYTLDYGEDDVLKGWDAIGEEHSAYITNANTTSAKVLIMTKTDKNKTWSPDNFADVGIDSDSDFRNKTGFQRSASETQQFINFNEVQEWRSDWKIKYVLTSARGDLATTAEAADEVKKINLMTKFDIPDGWELVDGHIVYTKEFRIDDPITGSHRGNIEEIFNVADKVSDTGYVRGEVYVGTTSMKDVSDSISLKQFVEQYINNTEGKVTGNERGNWLKVIDNDNDGQADYVLKVVYTMAQVVRAKDGKYGLDTQNLTLTDGDGVNSITSDEAVSTDTLALDDIVYYTYVDDVIRAWKAGVASVKIDTVNRKDLKVKTSDGTEYTESGVHGKHVQSNEYNCGVVNLNGSATYDIYLDRGGYLALFTDSNAGDFKLIVDGWYNSTKSGIEYAAYVYNDETGRQDVVDITRGGNLFISNGVSNRIQNNDWNALKWLGGVIEGTGALSGAGADLNGNGTAVKTTVATLTGDGVLLPVDYASNSSTGRTVRMVVPNDHKTIPTSSATYEARFYATGSVSGTTDTAYDAPQNWTDKNGVVHNTVELRALSNTVYYLVYPRTTNESGFAVERYVGYSSVPSIDKEYIEDVYAVATQQNRVSTLGDDIYYTANVVVVELKETYKGFAEQVFIYDMPVANASVTIENVGLIHENGTMENVDIDLHASDLRDYRVALNVSDGWTTWGPGLYYLYRTNTENLYAIKPMTPADIAENGYAVGWADTALKTASSDYVSVVAFDNNGAGLGYTDNGTAYDLVEKSAASASIYTLSYNDRGIADLGTYDASAGNIQKYLGERKDETSEYKDGFEHNHRTPGEDNITSWNQNRVLVHYNGNSIQYAISFANNDSRQLARRVWAASRPDSSVWESENNNRSDAIEYARFMAEEKIKIKDVYNVDQAIKTRMADALIRNKNLISSDLNDGSEVRRLETKLRGNVAEYTVTVVDADNNELDRAQTIDRSATFTLKGTVDTATADNGATVTKNGSTITVSNVTADTVVTVTFTEDPPKETSVEVLFFDEEGNAVEELNEDDNADVIISDDETTAKINLTTDGYNVNSVEFDSGEIEPDEDGVYTIALTAGAVNTVKVTVEKITNNDITVKITVLYVEKDDGSVRGDPVSFTRTADEGRVTFSKEDFEKGTGIDLGTNEEVIDVLRVSDDGEDYESIFSLEEDMYVLDNLTTDGEEIVLNAWVGIPGGSEFYPDPVLPGARRMRLASNAEKKTLSFWLDVDETDPSKYEITVKSGNEDRIGSTDLSGASATGTKRTNQLTGKEERMWHIRVEVDPDVATPNDLGLGIKLKDSQTPPTPPAPEIDHYLPITGCSLQSNIVMDKESGNKAPVTGDGTATFVVYVKKGMELAKVSELVGDSVGANGVPPYNVLSADNITVEAAGNKEVDGEENWGGWKITLKNAGALTSFKVATGLYNGKTTSDSEDTVGYVVRIEAVPGSGLTEASQHAYTYTRKVSTSSGKVDSTSSDVKRCIEFVMDGGGEAIPLVENDDIKSGSTVASSGGTATVEAIGDGKYKITITGITGDGDIRVRSIRLPMFQANINGTVSSVKPTVLMKTGTKDFYEATFKFPGSDYGYLKTDTSKYTTGVSVTSPDGKTTVSCTHSDTNLTNPTLNKDGDWEFTVAVRMVAGSDATNAYKIAYASGQYMSTYEAGKGSAVVTSYLKSGDTYQVTLENGEGYTVLDGVNTLNVEAGGTAQFVIGLDQDYELILNGDEDYRVSSRFVREITVTVENVRANKTFSLNAQPADRTNREVNFTFYGDVRDAKTGKALNGTERLSAPNGSISKRIYTDKGDIVKAKASNFVGIDVQKFINVWFDGVAERATSSGGTKKMSAWVIEVDGATNSLDIDVTVEALVKVTDRDNAFPGEYGLTGLDGKMLGRIDPNNDGKIKPMVHLSKDPNQRNDSAAGEYAILFEENTPLTEGNNLSVAVFVRDGYKITTSLLKGDGVTVNENNNFSWNYESPEGYHPVSVTLRVPENLIDRTTYKASPGLEEAIGVYLTVTKD